jgi:diguanylate cyclase (GGDEF)-like protein
LSRENLSRNEVSTGQHPVDLLASLIEETLRNAAMPASIPAELEGHAGLCEVLNKLVQIQQFVIEIASGNLETEVNVPGKVAVALKSLQANLRHLTWQTQRIAAGDLSQRVDFLGDFAAAYNAMVEQIAQSHADLELRARELSEQRRAALNLMIDAHVARQEAEKANQLLKEQLVEIQALQAQLREQAIRDPLTACFNRRYLQETIEREFARARREEYPVSFIMIDLDRFKTVNDTYGHKAGDEVLVGLGHLLLTHTRPSDVVSRYGGEEFLIMLPTTPLPVAVARAEQLCQAFAQLRTISGNKIITCTMSAGVACFPQHGQAEYGIIEKADQALYLAKSAGRNRVMAYPTV